MILKPIATALAFADFGVPLAYYYYAKSKWYSKPWSIKIDENCGPRVTVVILNIMKPSTWHRD